MAATDKMVKKEECYQEPEGEEEEATTKGKKVIKEEMTIDNKMVKKGEMATRGKKVKKEDAQSTIEGGKRGGHSPGQENGEEKGTTADNY